MKDSPAIRPRLGAGARAWIVAGRVASPLAALALGALALLPPLRSLRGSAGTVLSGAKSVAGPSEAVRLASGRRLAPGVFSDWGLSHRMNLELPREELDAAYLARLGPRADLGIVLKGLWSALLDDPDAARVQAKDHFDLFGVVVNNSETALVLDTLDGMVRSHPNTLVQMLPGGPAEPAPPAHVVFVNANNFNLAVEQPAYMRVLRGAELVLPDGIGVKLALRMVGGKLRRNLNGTDLLPHLASLFIKREWPVFLLGATSEVLARAKANLARRHPGLVVAGVHDGYFKPADEAALCDEINASGAMVLLIGMGTPRQEQWAARNAPRLSVPLVLSMGGLLDFLGEKNRRAPLWMRQAGLEWVFRLLQEPRRMWRRYVIGNPVFLWRVRRWARSRPAPRKGR